MGLIMTDYAIFVNATFTPDHTPRMLFNLGILFQ